MKSFTKKSLSILALSLTGAVACGSFVGCGSDDDDTTGGGSDAGKTDSSTTTDSGSKTDGATGTDSGPTGDSGPSDAGDGGDTSGGVTITRTGTVAFSQSTASAFVIKSASAGFIQTETTGTPVSTCTTTAAGASCMYTVCTIPAPVDAGTPDAGDAGDAGDASDAAPPTAPNAAEIAITGFAGTGAPTGGITLDFGKTTPNVYTVTSPTTISTDFATMYAAGGETLTFASATGNTTSVGAFTGTVVMPKDISVTAPAFSTGVGAKTANFPLGSDLDAAWSAGTAGTNVLVTIGSYTSAHTKTVSCTFPAAGGTGTIPTAGALTNLDPAGTGVTTIVSFTPTSSSVVKAGNVGAASTASDAWTVNLEATGTGASGSYTNN